MNIRFIYKANVIEILSKFTYLGIVFTIGDSFNTTVAMLAGQALTAIYKLKSTLYGCFSVKYTTNGNFWGGNVF